LDGMTAEREAILSAFENEEVRLRGMLEDVRQTAEATTALSTSLNETFGTFDELVESLRRPSDDPSPDSRPFDITDYQRTAESITATAQELNTTLGSLQELLASPSWEDRTTQFQEAAAGGEASMERLIDRAFQRGLVVVLALVVGLFVAAALFRLFFRPKGG
jgi:hypothetical protein